MMQQVAVAPRARTTAVLRAYHELTTPGITLFVGLSAAAGYALAAGAAVDAATLVCAAAATMLMSGGAAALNQVVERDVDALMQRTRGRPLPSGIITANAATVFGWLLTTLGALLATTLLPPLAFIFLAACHVSYIYCYTPLKRSSELCTLVGAIPGALPVLAGAAAAGGAPNPAALALTGLLFVWQIPHFMAIGWLAREDYARAGFVMLPVVDESGRRTARVALLYAIATQGFAILTAREAGAAPLMLAVIHTAGTAYVVAAALFLRSRHAAAARRLFFTSLVVLPAILGMLMLVNR